MNRLLKFTVLDITIIPVPQGLPAWYNPCVNLVPGCADVVAFNGELPYPAQVRTNKTEGLDGI
ncbi:MAG TPA: hypothetical protein DIC22_10070 [Chitinophagaceae bacterium]|nr:hypothetical protein [Chitinophagaceae bacterium]